MPALVQTLCQHEKTQLNQWLGVIINSIARNTAGKQPKTGDFVASERQHPGHKAEIPFKSKT
jgi:hypothetical protein